MAPLLAKAAVPGTMTVSNYRFAMPKNLLDGEQRCLGCGVSSKSPKALRFSTMTGWPALQMNGLQSHLPTFKGNTMTDKIRLKAAIDAVERHIKHSEADHETRLAVMYAAKALRELAASDNDCAKGEKDPSDGKENIH